LYLSASRFPELMFFVKIKHKITHCFYSMSRIQGLYGKLCQRHGLPKGQWGLWCRRPKTIKEKEEVIIGAVLGQRTNWNNVEKAIANLKQKKICSFKAIYDLGNKDIEGLAQLIRPSGFFRQKAQYLFNLAKFIVESHQGIEAMENNGVRDLRKDLLKLKGLGPETVDSILLYGLSKPVFVIDEYTKRFVKEHKLAEILSYQSLQELFEGALPKDYCLYQDFHALIIIEQKTPTGQKLLFK